MATAAFKQEAGVDSVAWNRFVGMYSPRHLAETTTSGSVRGFAVLRDVFGRVEILTYETSGRGGDT